MIRNTIFFQKAVVLLAKSCAMTFCIAFGFSAFANQGNTSILPNNSESSDSKTNITGTVSPYITVDPKSLAEQKLIPSSLPEEAELYCGTGNCMFGLSRGLVVGSRLMPMIYSPLFDSLNPKSHSERYYLIDAFGGFQILRNVDLKNFMNAEIGYRRIQLNDDSNKIVNQGITVNVNYSQLVTSIFTMSLEFSAFLTIDNVYIDNPSGFVTNSAAHSDFKRIARNFYEKTQNSPTYRVALPAYFEFANWGTKQTSLPMPIRLYGEIAPFYVQNVFNYNNKDVSFNFIEQDFGARFAAISSYESTDEQSKPGRYSIKLALGLDISSSSNKTTSSSNVDLELPNRPIIEPCAELAGSWQF